MRFSTRLAVLAAATIITPPSLVAAQPAPPAPLSALVKDVSIPYTTFKLKNGLTVIVHEDHKAPVVGGVGLVPRRLEGRAQGQDRLRPPVRASDVQRVGECARTTSSGRLQQIGATD